MALLSIFGKEEISCIDELKQCYYILEKGYNSMPINLPGTLFHKAMKARKQLGRILADILSSRRQKKAEADDLLGSLMETKQGLTDDQIADNIIGVIFASRDTTASVLTWIVKYLGENPSILRAVTVRFLSSYSFFFPFSPFSPSVPVFLLFEGVGFERKQEIDSLYGLLHAGRAGGGHEEQGNGWRGEVLDLG